MRQIRPARFYLSIVVCVLLSLGVALRVQAQAVIHPTPVVIQLTPATEATVPPTATTMATVSSPYAPDYLEPNNSAENATQLGWQTIQGLTLIAADTDYFVGFLKAGQMVQVETMTHESLDTHLTLRWGGVVAAENDDKSATEVGSRLTYTAQTDGSFHLQVSKVTAFDGKYDLHVSLIEPTTTPSPSPTQTSSPTMTPTHTPQPTVWATHTPQPTTTTIWATHTPQPTVTAVWPTHTPQPTATSPVWPTQTPTTTPSPVSTQPPWPTHMPEPTATLSVWATQVAKPTATTVHLVEPMPTSQAIIAAHVPTVTVAASAIMTTPVITLTQPLSLSIRHLGRVTQAVSQTNTHIRLLVYYDANNDRAPSPGEGIPNVSVLAVDSMGQRIARVFTNAQGDAIFNITSDAITRVVVPLVPAWSARIRAGEQNDGIVLGLPAVRLPVFLPVATGEEQ